MEGDEKRIKQILLNLISNAFKFTKSGGTIKLRVENEMDENNENYEIRDQLEEESNLAKSRIRFSVSDTGIGIKTEHTGKLFKAFGMLHDTADVNPSGKQIIQIVN